VGFCNIAHVNTTKVVAHVGNYVKTVMVASVNVVDCAKVRIHCGHDLGKL
jgi:hypothetical protein